MNKRIIILLLILLPVLQPLRSQAANGLPLDGFGNYSAVKITGTGIRAIALQRWDGRILIGGDFTVTDYSAAIPIVRTNLARLNTDGTLDASFALNPEKEVRAIAVDSVNKVIYAGGLSGNIGGQWRNGLARISSLGVLESFDPAGANSEVNAITVQQGSVLVGGKFTSMSGTSCNNIARIYDDGTPTENFSGGVTGGDVQALLVQDGMTVVGGSFTSWGGFTPARPHLARFTASGIPDATFSASPGGSVRALALQADGMILVGGDFVDVTTGIITPSTQARNYLARLTAKGELDGFNAALDNSLPVAGHYVGSIAVQPDGKILIAGNFTQVGATARNNVARLNINDTLDQDADPKKDFDPNADGVVDVITMQPDGKFLIGGEFGHVAGATSPATPALRARLARFYRNGALDEDVFSLGTTLDTVTLGGTTIPGAVMALSLQPDETVGIGGQFTFVSGKVRWRVAKLNRDWTLASQPNLPLDSEVDVLVPQPDGKLIVGGQFSDSDNGYWSMRRLDPLGIPEPAFDANIFSFRTDWDIPVYGLADTEAVALSPTGPPLPDGAPSLDIYLGGIRSGEVPFYLAKLNSEGVRDTDFDTNVANAPALVPAVPSLLDGDVTAIAIQPDDKKVLIGTASGKIMRFQANGVLDAGFSVLQLDGRVNSLALQPSGQIIAGGDFNEPVTRVISALTGEEKTWDQSILRINKADGSIDNTFNFETNGPIDSAALQADGGIVIAGTFDTDGSYNNVMDVNGVEAKRHNLARIGPNGELDGDFDLGTFQGDSNSGFNKINALKLQSDGKLIIAGGFIRMNNDETRQRLVRVSNGWSTQELSVSQDGKEVSWLRDGPAPELWRVVFEYSADGSAWEYLGDASRIPGVAGWRLPDANLGNKPNGWYTNHYVRATGYVAAEKQGSSSLVQSVRIYYLKPILTITAAANQSKIYGSVDPVLTYNASGFVNGDTADILTGSLSRVSGTNVGSYGITRGSLSAGDNYTIVFVGADFKITPAPLSVKADNLSKSYGAANPSLSATPSGFVNGDPTTILTGSPTLSTTALPGSPTGSYPISASLGTLAATANYTITCADGTLSVDPATLTITARNEVKHYGDPNPTFTFIPSGFVNGDTQSILSGFPALTTTAVTGSPAGSYPISAAAGNLTAGSNYIVSYAGGLLRVNTATLTITADSKSKTCGTSDPVLTFSASGFQNGDTLAILTGSLTRAAGEEAGSYPITVGSMSAGNNYSINFVGADLAILATAGAAPQNITFNDMRPKTFGDGDFDPGATASSNLPVDYASSASNIASVVAGKIRVVAPGTSEITASQAGNEAYLPATPVTRTLIVNPPPWNSLSFDGIDDLMRIPDAAQLNFGSKTGFSIETWLRLDGSQPDGTGIVSKGEGGSPWSGYQLILHQDRIGAEIGGRGSSIGIAEGLVATSSLNDGQWHHVALTVDRLQATAALYLDGRLEAQLANPALNLTPDNADALLVGTDRSGSLFFKGEIDEVRIWDTVRSQAEIRAAVSQIIDPLDEPHLAAYFHFDEGDANLDNAAFASAPERTAHGANGSLQGFALSGTASNWTRSGAFIPLLETAPISAISSGSATSGGVVYPNYYPATEAGLCWGSGANPGLTDSCRAYGSGTGPFVGVITGLTPGATYHVRGYATNLMGTAYGNDVTFQVTKLGQTVDIGTITDKTYGDAGFTPGGSSTSGLPITYTSSDPGVAIVVGGEIQITGAGTTTITASQGGNETYSPAGDVSQTFTVSKAPLTVTADNKSRAYLTANPTLNANYQGFVKGENISVISGLPDLSTGATQASLAGTYDIVVRLGTLAAKNYSFVLRNGTLSVFKSCQEIVFPAIGERTFGDPPFAIIASACSGLGIGFSSSDPQVAQINGNIVTIIGAGSVVITASQPGSGNLETAPDVSLTVIVHKSGQGVTFSSLAQKVLGDPPFALSATASSGLAVTYASSDPAVAVISGNLVTIVGAGTTVITAAQGGNGNYNAALPASQPLTVALEGVPPYLALSTLASGAVTSDPVLNIMGSASDASGIASLTVNGVDLTGQAALFSSAVPLASGDNSIIVSAKDGAGNQTTQILSIMLDAAAPAVTLSAPADNSVSDVSFFTASGRVTTGSTVSLLVNGGSPLSLSVTDGSFTGSGYLENGVNTLELVAALSGRSSRIKRSVMLAPGKPTLALTEPVEDIRTEFEGVTLSGVARAQGSEVSVVIEVDGSVFTPAVQSGVFHQAIALNHAGQFRIKVSATDSGGNTSVAYRNIIKVDRIAGDLNGDGSVDVQDAVALLRISLGLDPPTAQALAHGDVAPVVNGVSEPDGRIDVGDVLVLLRKIVGLVDF